MPKTYERGRFRSNARLFRDYFVQQGSIEARYLPLLLFGIALGFTFLHAMILYRRGTVDIPDIIAVMGLMNVLRFPVFISIWSFSLVQHGSGRGTAYSPDHPRRDRTGRERRRLQPADPG